MMATQLRILALDPATKCGFAHSDGASGTWDLSVKRDESSGMRLLRLAGKLNAVLEDVGIDLLVFEAARHAAPGMQGALVVQAELQGQIKAWCDARQIPYRGYSPSEVKKYATGKGNANKEKMLKTAQAIWPLESITDDNQADARFLLALAGNDYAGCCPQAVGQVQRKDVGGS